MVLADGGPNRIPPQSPGSTPDYLISQDRLQTYWDSSRPVVFITDFLRQPGASDPADLNLPQNSREPLLVVGLRKLYGNTAARERWLQRQSVVLLVAGLIAQAQSFVPTCQGFLRIALELMVVWASRNLNPACGKIQHDVGSLWGLREVGVNGRSERVH